MATLRDPAMPASALPAHQVRRRTAISTVGAIAGLILVVVLALAPEWSDAGTMNSLVQILTLLCLAQMWNLLAGYGGMVSIGLQLYVGIGAYSVVFFGNNHGVNAFLCVPLALLVGAAIAMLLAGPAFRLRGGYFAIGTWVMAQVASELVAKSTALGGGTGTSLTVLDGIDPVVRINTTYWLALVAGAGSVLIVYVLLQTRVGSALFAVRDAEPAARSLGVRVTQTKLIAFVIAGAGSAFAGAVIALNLINIQPTDAFSVTWTADMIFITLIGGLGTIEGPIIGTIIFYVLQQWLQNEGQLYLIVLGAIAVAVTVWLPEGIWGWVASRYGISLFPLSRRVRNLDLSESTSTPSAKQ
jgi:branched-chain amino acid transport system permease protein